MVIILIILTWKKELEIRKKQKKVRLKNWIIKKIERVRLQSERKEQENIQKIEDKIIESKIEKAF